tara:strand:- start:3807 stop:4010 length:204 start_codon:yes stop_codon:yes gene_type:complete
MKRGKILYKENNLRVWNELATVFLFSIIFLAVLKTSISWLYATVGLILIALILTLLIKAYKRYFLDK